MPRTITKTIYTFQELLDLEKVGKPVNVKKARAWLQEANTSRAADGEWYDYTLDLWKQALAQIGFLDAEIQFSGFWSQGDGASFTANIDIERLADFLSREIEPKNCIIYLDTKGVEDFRPWIVHKCGGKVTNPSYDWLMGLGEYLVEHQVYRISHHYYHENTCAVGLSMQHCTRAAVAVHDRLSDFEHDVEELRRDLCQAIHQTLEAEYEYLIEDEALLELAEANDYTFTINGRREG